MKRARTQRGKAATEAILLAASLLVLAGCTTVGPDYEAPVTSTPGAWTSALSGGVAVAGADAHRLERWWTVFDDPMLSDLIERARAGNRDLRQAEARVRQARAQRGLAKADLFPVVGAAGSATRTRSSEQAGLGATSDFYGAGLDASWELDVFGGKRRALESATASVQAAEESLRDVLVSLLAEVGLNYVAVRSYQELIAITESSVTTRSETHDITRWRCEAGLTTQLDVDQARLSLEQARAQVPALRTSLEQAKHRLDVLLGQSPGGLNAVLAEPKPVPATAAEVAVGLPADLLRRRPDVRNAERQLASQTAQIGVAKAAMYPDLSLLGSIGLESPQFAELYSASAWTAQGAAKAAWTLFAGGRVRQNIQVQTARQEEALRHYEATVLAALEEVENTLVAYANEQARQQALAAAVESGRSAFNLARDQYASGLVNFQTVLDTQQALLSAQDQLAVSRAKVISNLIGLYKALGGGWAATSGAGGGAGILGLESSKHPTRSQPVKFRGPPFPRVPRILMSEARDTGSGGFGGCSCG